MSDAWEKNKQNKNPAPLILSPLFSHAGIAQNKEVLVCVASFGKVELD